MIATIRVLATIVGATVIRIHITWVIQWEWFVFLIQGQKFAKTRYLLINAFNFSK